MYGRTQVLAHPTMLHEVRGGATHVDLLEAGGLDVLLPAALRSKATDELLGTPVFMALLQQRMRVLWPIHWLEFTLLVGLCVSYVAWAFGAEVRKTPSWPRSWANFSLL